MASQTASIESEIFRIKTIRALPNDQPITTEEEAFLLANWTRLDPLRIVYWLSKSPPEGSDIRPHSKLIERILPAVEECLVRDGLRIDLVGELIDPLAKGELLDRLRGRLEPRTWAGLLRHADGCTAYLEIARAERRLLEAGGWSGEDSIAAMLFDLRRDQVRVESHLEVAIRTLNPSHVQQLAGLLKERTEHPGAPATVGEKPRPATKDLIWGDCFGVIRMRPGEPILDSIDRLRALTAEELRQALFEAFRGEEDAWMASGILRLLGSAGVPSRALGRLVAEKVASMGTGSVRASDLGELLSSGALWADPGSSIVAPIIRSGRREDLGWLRSVVGSTVVNLKRGGKPLDAVVTGIHLSLADALIDSAAELLERRAFEEADLRLRSLACLIVPPRFFRRLRAMNASGLPPSTRAWLDQNEALAVRRDDDKPDIGDAASALELLQEW